MNEIEKKTMDGD